MSSGEGSDRKELAGVSMSASTCPSNHENALLALRERGISAVFQQRSRRFEGADDEPDADGGEGTDKCLLGLLAECLKRSVVEEEGSIDGATPKELSRLVGPVVGALDIVHENEEAFSIALYDAVVKCFTDGGWKVHSNPSTTRRREVRLRLSQPQTQQQQQQLPQLHPSVIGEETGGGATPPPVQEEEEILYFFDDMIIVGRRAGPVGARDAAVTPPIPPRSSAATTTPSAAQGNQPLEDEEGANPYLCRVGDRVYATGLSRKVKVKDPEGLSIIKGDSFPDLAWVIFEKTVNRRVGRRKIRRDEWTVRRLLAAVELKTAKSSGKLFDVVRAPLKRLREEGGSGSHGSAAAAAAAAATTMIVGVNPKGSITEHGPLAHTLSYVVGHALPGRAALGLDLPRSVPFAVLAGKCSSKPVPPNALRWLHGNVITPEECGGGFYYSVDAFGGFDRRPGGMHALAALLDVIRSGLKAGDAWLAGQASGDQPDVRSPTPLCGRTLKFGSVDLSHMPLMYSPLSREDGPLNRVSIGAVTDQPDAGRWETVKASQGEIFGGKVNVAQLQTNAPGSEYITWLQDAVGGKSAQPVLVKVVSRACFGQLVGMEGLMWRHESMDFALVRKYLAPSLFAVYTVFDEGAKRGLVQLMPDLTTHGVEPLRPEMFAEDGEQWKRMWTAFTVLVRGTLIPLAEGRVIHPDLRPGHNRTANLLYNRKWAKCASSTWTASCCLPTGPAPRRRTRGTSPKRPT
jgi:hypothetical protein